MAKRKYRHQWTSPSDRNWGLFSSMSLEDVLSRLNMYLNGEIAVVDGPPTKRRKKKRGRTKNAPLSGELFLLQSIAFISFRIIRKYEGGGYPHPDRVTLWNIMLELTGRMEEDGGLPVRENAAYRTESKNGGLIFQCRRYDIPEFGALIIPENAQSPQDAQSPDIPAMPAIYQDFHFSIGRKTAAEAIQKAADSRGIPIE